MASSGPSGCLSHPSSLPLRSSAHLARSWGLLGEAVSGSASWLERLTIQTPPHLQVPCPVPPPCSELCKSRLAGGSRSYRPLAPRGGPVQRQFWSANSIQVDSPTSTIETPSLQPHCEWPQTPGSSNKSELPDGRVGKPPCLEWLLRASEGLQAASRLLLGFPATWSGSVYGAAWNMADQGCSGSRVLASSAFTLHLLCPTHSGPHSRGLWELGPTALDNPALRQPQQSGQAVPSLLRTWAFPAFLYRLTEASKSHLGDQAAREQSVT